MGTNQSTRKITVVNDEASGVIKISEAVVQRIKGEIAEEAKPTTPVPSPPVPETATSLPAPETATLPPAREMVTPPAPETALPSEENSSPPSPIEVPTPRSAEAPYPPPAEETSPVSEPVIPPTHEPTPPPETPASQTESQVPQPAYIWQRPIIQYIEEPSLSALRVRTEKEEELVNLENYWRERLSKQESEHIAQAKLTEEEVARSARLVEGLFIPASSAGEKICRDASDAVQACYSSHPQQPLLCRDKVLQFSQCVHQARTNLLTKSG